MSRRLCFAAFDDEHALLEAAAGTRRHGADPIDAHSPYPIHGIDEVLGIRRSRLTLVCFAGGLVGLSLGLLFQYWTSAVDWALNVGGKPFNSLPGFMPVAFELTVLIGGLSTAFALFARSRLWPGKGPRRAIEGVTDDRFVLVVAAKDPTLPARELSELLVRLGAVHAWEELEP